MSVVMDNHATRGAAAVGAWPAGRPHRHVRFMPTSASRTDQVGRRFAEPARKRLQRGVRAPTGHPEADIRPFIERHNRDPKPFRRTKSADDIPDAIKRFCHRVNYDYISNFKS